jgi:AcrR family transcriptional regulator
MAVQVTFLQDPAVAPDLRSRKRERTRRAIREAALDLFAEQGYEATSIEQIVARAESSISTFFRLFGGKSDLLVSDDGTQLSALQSAIIDRPSQETDLIAACQAILANWIRPIADADLSLRAAAAVESSPLLRGLRYDVVRGWVAAVADALARRNGLKVAAVRHKMIGRIVIGVFGDSVEEWIAGGCRGNIRMIVRRDFKALMVLREDMIVGEFDTT